MKDFWLSGESSLVIGSQTSERLGRNFDKKVTSQSFNIVWVWCQSFAFGTRTCNVFDYFLTKLTILGIEFQVSSSFSLEESCGPEQLLLLFLLICKLLYHRQWPQHHLSPLQLGAMFWRVTDTTCNVQVSRMWSNSCLPR